MYYFVDKCFNLIELDHNRLRVFTLLHDRFVFETLTYDAFNNYHQWFPKVYHQQLQSHLMQLYRQRITSTIRYSLLYTIRLTPTIVQIVMILDGFRTDFMYHEVQCHYK